MNGIIGEKLTDAWMLRAVPLAQEFPVTGDGETVRKAATLHRRNPDEWIVFVG